MPADALAPADALPARGRRCYLTVLFCDVTDSSRHAEELEAEDYAALLHRFRQFAREVIPRHHGAIVRLQGDGLLALFGLDGSDENDGRHATEAALALHAAVRGLRVGAAADAPSLQLHSGIHAGLVLLLDGGIELGRHDVVGEVANTAARLCSMATAGEVLVSVTSLGPHEHLFEARWKRRLAVRGRRAALDVVSALEPAAPRRRIDAAARRGVVPLQGRDATLASLLAAATAEPGTGTPRVVHLSGEPGVGKTRLLDEFRQRLDGDGFFVLQGHCDSELSAEPLQPFQRGLRAALQALPAATEAAEGNTRADPTPPTASPEGVATEALRSGQVGPLLAQLALDRRWVFILDDWQWADDASRKLLHRLLAEQPGLLVILATRLGALVDDPLVQQALVLELQPLDEAATRSAIRAWLPGADEFTVQQIQLRCGGSPLFLEELCHAALADDDWVSAPVAPGVAWINALVASRMARLPARLGEFLRLASVIGNQVPLALMAQLASEPPAQALEPLAALGFLVPLPAADAFRFRHGLTRDAVYATIDSAQRQRWHLRVAQTLEAGQPAAGDEALAALAYHYHAAQRSEQAAHFAVAAGDQALAAMALDRARALYLTALQSLDALPLLSPAMQLQWCSIAQRMGQTCVFDPLDMNECAPMFARAVTLAEGTGDLNMLARAEYWMAYVGYGRGRPRDAVHFCRLALAHAHASGDERLEAQLQATLGQSLASAGRYDEALPALQAAVERKRSQSRPGSGTAIGSAYSLARLGYSHGDLGHFGLAHELLDQAMAMLGDVDHSLRASILELRCAVHLWQGHWQAAREAGFAGADVALRCRSRYLTAMGRALGGCAQWALARDLPAYAALRDATYLIDARGGAVSTSLNFGWLLEAAVELGQAQDLQRHSAGLLRRARQQDTHGHAMGCRALAQAAAQQGRLDAAAAQLARAERSAARRGSAREQALNALARARLAAAAGRPDAARPALDHALGAFEQMDMAWHRDQALQLDASITG